MTNNQAPIPKHSLVIRPFKRHAMTPFQRRVYAVVKRIPCGTVRSYQWVAKRLGNARLARAVGQALKRNPRPITIPCHRVIRSDGSVGGYAFGVVKKRRLLAQERIAIRRSP
jgi:methylated-DNA-[protein]-cysteine S-methyltransferase